MNKKPHQFKIRNTIIASIGIHLLGMGWLGMFLNDHSPASTLEPVLTVDLVSVPPGGTKDIKDSYLSPNQVQPKNPLQRPDFTPSDASPKARIETTPLRRPDRPVYRKVDSPASIKSVQEKSGSMEPFVKGSANEGIEEKRIPAENVQPHSPPQSPQLEEEVIFTWNKENSFSGRPSGPQKPSESTFHPWSHYLKAVKDRIERLKRYPWLARLKGREGSTRLGFTITRNGEPGNVRLLQSSGWKELDEESINIVKRVGQFPYPPKDWNEDLRVEVPMVFHLDEAGGSNMMR